jgi:ABC-type multidrug transport system fused ATPase/permease subunit
MSPVVSNVTEAVRGRLVGRTLGCDLFFVQRHLTACQHFLQASYTAQSLMQFNAVMTQIIAITVSSAVSVFVLLNPDTDPKLAGIALTYSFLLPYFLSLASDMFMMFFSVLPALERVFEFLPNGDIPSEAPRTRSGDAALVARGWPEAGGVAFDKVAMRYRKDTPLALKGFSLELRKGEKCGIVGRTGAGKSSLLAVLFRLTEPQAGTISIDGVDLSGVGLKTLRQSLAMIPQEAVLIEGTVRENLDPFGREATQALEGALGKVGLSPSILEHEVGTGGDSFSVGERQLLAIARVLLKRDCTVYVMDEPTAHIDPATDAHLQRIIRHEFEDATLLTIAHRLHTVADFDKVVVMDGGKLAEVGRPLDLLNDATGRGHFAQMVAALGPAAAAAIRAKAMEGAARGEKRRVARALPVI